MSYPDHLIDYWKENGITPPVEKVVCAANRLEDGTIIAGPYPIPENYLVSL